MDQESAVGKGVGEKSVAGDGRMCRHKLGKFNSNGLNSKGSSLVARELVWGS